MKENNNIELENNVEKVKILKSYQYYALYIILPVLNNLNNSWWVLILPLHFLEMGWDLNYLAILYSVFFTLRVINDYIITKFGYWLTPILSFVCILFYSTLIFWQNHLWAIFLGIIGTYGLHTSIPVYGLSYKLVKFNDNMQQIGLLIRAGGNYAKAEEELLKRNQEQTDV
ncbi:hypothetical protein CPAV1605_1072 [seawater metagenome]|uniref:Uncharacterized protein n=1 Tax=seawater metagenome TaxID=1561972 RepID=A0A5E8CJ84_9ZZZZ